MRDVRPLVVVLLFEGVDLLDVTGPPEVFALAHREDPEVGSYEVVLAASDLCPVRSAAGVRVLPDVTFGDLAHRAIDTLIVPGAVSPDAGGRLVPVVEADLVEAIRDLGARAHRIASVCVGAHLLAAAGLLDGRRATTHWSTAGILAARYPSVEVDADPIYVQDGRIWTGAGISSCLDLSLALIAEDHGEELALRVARQLVMYLKRPGGQSQFSVPLTRVGTTPRVELLRHHILENLTEQLTVPELAAVAHVGERHLTRLFKQELGMTPRCYVESLRIESARRLLESTTETVEGVARRCGFRSVDSFLRAFHRTVGATPREYRLRFGAVRREAGAHR